MSLNILFLIFSLLALVHSNPLKQEASDSQRSGKFIWPFLTFIIVEEACTSQSATSPTGTCLTQKTCTSRGGTASGTCAQGFAVCCLLELSCGTSSSYNGTHFTSPSYPSSDSTTGSCTHQIQYGTNICQVRLDFIDFSLAQPDTDGQCTTDSFTVTGGGLSTGTIPTICGDNVGQHMYIDVNPSSSPLQLNVNRGSGGQTPALDTVWNINVTQIPCGATYAAPSNCLQYYTTSSGNIQSFNYAGDSTGNPPDAESVRQLSDQNYAICIRPESTFCSLTWAMNSDDGPYGLSLSEAADRTAVDAAGTIDAAGFDCSTDYLLIPGGSYTDGSSNAATGDRFCGQGFPTTVTTSTRPFNVYFVTDSTELTTDTGNQGFSMDYTANICS